MKKKYLFCMFCFLILILSACGTSTKGISEEEVKDVLTEEFHSLIQYDQEDENANPLIRVIEEGFEISDIQISKSNDQYYIDCIISNYDVNGAISSFEESQENISLEEYADMISNAIKASEKKSSPEQFTIVQTDSGYEVQYTEEQLDDALGGLITYYNGLTSEGVE